MITVLTDIPDYAFSSSLSELAFTTTSESATVVIKSGNNEILNEKYVSDSSDKIRVRDLSLLLEPYLSTNLIEPFSYSIIDGSGSRNKQFTVQYCAVEVPHTASAFMAEYFLSSLLGEKITASGRKEFLHLVASEACQVAVECCYLMNVKTTVETVVLKQVSVLNKVVTIDVSPDQFKKNDWKLLYYSVKAGRRIQQFKVDLHSEDAAPCLLFTNSFGCQETIYCVGTHQAVPEYARNAAYIDGKFKNFQIDENRVFKACTGVLNISMANWADDLFRSKEIYLLVNSLPDKEITITDSKSERSNNSDALPNFTFEYRYSQRNHNILQLGRAGRIFDNTFDGTFE